jgi:hypothetical protein
MDSSQAMDSFPQGRRFQLQARLSDHQTFSTLTFFFLSRNIVVFPSSSILKPSFSSHNRRIPLHTDFSAGLLRKKGIPSSHAILLRRGIVGRRNRKVHSALISFLININHLNPHFHSQPQLLQLTHTRVILPLQRLKVTRPKDMVPHIRQRTPSNRMLRPKTTNGLSKGTNQAIHTPKHMATKPGQGMHLRRVLTQVIHTSPRQ